MRFDVYRSPDSDGYLLSVQADLLDDFNTRVVVPLLPMAAAPKPAKRLNPVFQVEGNDVVMVTQYMAAVPRAVLRQQVGNLAPNHREIIDAIDMLLQGF